MNDSDKGSFECLLDQFSPKRLHLNNRLFTGSISVIDGSYGKPSAPNAFPKQEEPIELVSDICEFAVGKCFNSENRTCIDKTFCPATVFKVPSQFQICHTRVEKLKEQI
jgi:hypothetical protein